MNILGDSTSRSLEMALDLRYQRQQLLASNIANADTPNYQPMDLTFEGTLAEAEASERGGAGMQRTDAAHMDHQGGETRVRDDVESRPDALNTLDGNGVDLDREVARFAENKARFEATVESSRRRFAILNYVISSMQTG